MTMAVHWGAVYRAPTATGPVTWASNILPGDYRRPPWPLSHLYSHMIRHITRLQTRVITTDVSHVYSKSAHELSGAFAERA